MLFFVFFETPRLRSKKRFQKIDAREVRTKIGADRAHAARALRDRRSRRVSEHARQALPTVRDRRAARRGHADFDGRLRQADARGRRLRGFPRAAGTRIAAGTRREELDGPVRCVSTCMHKYTYWNLDLTTDLASDFLHVQPTKQKNQIGKQAGLRGSQPAHDKLNCKIPPPIGPSGPGSQYCNNVSQ